MAHPTELVSKLEEALKPQVDAVQGLIIPCVPNVCTGNGPTLVAMERGHLTSTKIRVNQIEISWEEGERLGESSTKTS